MADEAVTLDELRRASGRKLLEMTDAVGFGALGAAWIHEPDADHWWYLLVTPMIDSKGPRWVYERLLKVFGKWRLPEGITPLDIRIISPQEAFYRRFPVKARNNLPGPLPEMELRSFHLPGLTAVDAAYVYRMDFRPQWGAERAATFDRKVRELLAA
jgi:hypothetical protein